MAKNIFQPIDIVQDSKIAYIDAPIFTTDGVSTSYEIPVNIPQNDELVDISSIDEVKADADALIKKTKEEAENLLNQAKEEALSIINNANEAARNMVMQTEQDLVIQRNNINKERDEIFEKAQKEADTLKSDAIAEVDDYREKGYKDGLVSGEEEGYKKGYEEVERLISRLHIIINRTVDKRNEIIDEVETQVVELALLMVRKVVKVIAENQKSVVINNIVQALRKMKSRSSVTIRVNLDDINVATENMDIFVKEIEGDGKLNFIEDNSIEVGGCIVETDFGEIDARISSQLSEIENRIRDLMPISIRPTIISDDTVL